MEHERLLMETDSDLEIVAMVSAGINERGELVIEYEFEDYEDERRNFKRIAIVDRQEALLMANSLNVQVTDLPDELYEELGEVGGVGVPSDAEGLFADVLDFILDCGAKYNLK